MSQQPLDRLIKLEDVMHQVGMGKTKIYDMIQFEEFPAPVKLGRYSRWSQLEVRRYPEQDPPRRCC